MNEPLQWIVPVPDCDDHELQIIAGCVWLIDQSPNVDEAYDDKAMARVVKYLYDRFGSTVRDKRAD
jgi:hypothetical protein